MRDQRADAAQAGHTQEEVRVLKEILAALAGGGRISFTPDQTRRLATAGKALNPEERKRCCQIVKPGTVLGWFRQMAARKYDSSKTKVGRPRKKKDIEIGRTTVANILLEEGIEPAPEREKKRTRKRYMVFFGAPVTPAS